MKLRRSCSFQKQYAKLPESIRKKLKRHLIYLIRDICHPTLQAKKMVNGESIWEARIDLHYRFTFQIKDNLKKDAGI